MDAPEVDEDEEGTRWDPRGLVAVVVGAGLTGCLAAHYLATRGYKVEVLERGPRPAPGDAASGPLVLTSRAAIAFEELGLTEQRRVGPSATPLRGVWDVPAASLRPLQDDSPYRRAFVADRSGLVSDVIAAAEQRYPDTVRFTFGATLATADLKNRTLIVRATEAAEPPAAAGATASSSASASSAQQQQQQTPAEQREGGPGQQQPQQPQAGPEPHEVEVRYDLLVGADGADSTVRRILQSKTKEMRVIQPVMQAAGVKAVRGLPRPPREPVSGFFAHQPQEYVYEWATPGRPALRLHLEQDGTAAGAVEGLARWDEPAAAAAELAAAYPDSLPREWAEEIGRQVASPASPAPRHPGLLQCSSFHGPRALLLGDAAHAVPGAAPPGCGSGQGPSAAVESVRTMALVLRGAQDHLDKVPEVYSKVRSDAVMAMQMLEFVELTRGDRSEARLKFGSPWFALSAAITQGFFFLSKLVGSLLASLLPGRFLSTEQLVSRLSDRRIGYSEVMRMMQGYAFPVVLAMLAAVTLVLVRGYSRLLA